MKLVIMNPSFDILTITNPTLSQCFIRVQLRLHVFASVRMFLNWDYRCIHARIQKIFSGGGGVQIPRRGLTENFNMAKINNLAIPGGGGGLDPLSPALDPPMAF